MFNRNSEGQGSLAFRMQPGFWGRLLSPFAVFSRRASRANIRTLLSQPQVASGNTSPRQDEPFGSVRNYHVVGVRQDEKKVAGSR